MVFWRRANQEEAAFKWLAFVFLTFSLILLHWVAFWKGLYESSLRGVGIVAGTLDFALAPIIYFFIRSLQNSAFKFSKHHLWHFVPFLFFFIVLLEISRLVAGTSETGPLFDAHDFSWFRTTYRIVSNGQFLAYGIWLFFHLRSESRAWIKTITVLFIIYFIGRLAYSALAITEFITPNIDYILSVIISTSIFSLAYLNQLRPIHFRSRKS